MRKELTHFIARHLDETVDAEDIKRGAFCAFTGEAIRTGVPLKKVIKPATRNLADTFNIISDYVSIETAICFKANRLLRGNLFIDETGIIAPMVSAKSAIKFNRPTWVEVLTEFCENPRDALILLTDESKRRLWIDAQLNINHWTGYATAYLNAYDQSGVLNFQCEPLLECLEVINECMGHGFNKDAIRWNLLRHAAIFRRIGLSESHRLEKELRHYRQFCADTFNIGIFIATVPIEN